MVRFRGDGGSTLRSITGRQNNYKVTAAHPGWTGTDLQRHSGIMRFLNAFFSQDADMAALPTLRAAIGTDAESGDYFGLSKFFEMHGLPVKMKSNKRSHSKQAARQLRELSEK